MRAPYALVVLVAMTAGCGNAQYKAAQEDEYRYEVVEEPHPGIAEGRPVVKPLPGRGTFYLCPELRVGAATPDLTDPCLTPGRYGASRYGDYSMLEASRDCPDGRRATDAGSLGVGFVGEPLIAVGDRQPHPDFRAVRRCLGLTPR